MRYDNINDNEQETPKKRFRFFDMNRDGKGVDEHEDRKPTLKFFFKLFGRKFTKIMQVNLLMIFQVIPLVIIALTYFSGDKTPTVTSLSFAPLYGISSIAGSSGSAPILDLSSVQMGIPVFTPSFMIAMIALVVILLVTFGWQNAGATYVLRGLFRGDPVFVFSDFFYGIKRNLKQGFFLGIIDALFMVVLVVDFMFFRNHAQSGTFGIDLMYFVIFALIIVYVMMRFYIYLLMITFDMKLTKIIKHSFIFTMLGIKRNLMAFLGMALIIALNIALILISLPNGFSLPLILPFVYLMGTVGFMTTYAAYPVIDKYMIEPYADKNVACDEEDISSDSEKSDQ